MKKIVCSILLCASMMVFAQRGTLTGNINDDSRIALPGAKLTLNPGNIHTVSDETGNFVFLNVPAGSYTLSVDYIGYGVKTYQVTVADDQSTRQNITFERNIQEIEGVTILGFGRQSQARALNTQKNNPNITNVVSSDQIGKFPDANIGDALKRVPGITMQNDQGEARNIIVRGLASELNSVTLNGNRIPSAEGDNRKVQMDLIPSDMIQMIEVNKTLTPDMDGDAIGGSVELKTRTAPNKERISLSVGSGFNPIRDKFALNDSFMYGNRFFDGKLGLVLNGSYNMNNYGSDNTEGVWTEDDNGNIYMEEMDIRKYDVKRERKSVGANLDFKFSDRHQINVNALYNWRDDWENRYRLTYTDVEMNDDGTYTGEMRIQTKGGINNRLNDGARLERQIMQNYSLGGDHILGSSVDLDWGVSYSKAEEQRPDERYIGWEQEGVDLQGFFGDTNYPLIKSAQTPNYSNFSLRELSEQQGNTAEDEFTGKVNIRFPFSIIEDQKGRIRVGGKFRIKSKERVIDFYEYEPTGSILDNMGQTNLIFWSGEKWNPNSKYVPGTFTTKTYLGNLDLNNSNIFDKTQLPEEFLSENYSAKEDIYAGYLRWDQNFSDKFSMIVGARVESTKTEYTGNIIEDEDSFEGVRTVENSYTNVLPSISFRYTPIENMVLRAAFSTALARPNYYQLSPYVSVIPDDNEVLAGNSDLKSTYAYNYDLMGEYYFQNVGIISLGGFYKRLNDFIYTYRDSSYTSEKFGQDFQGIENRLNPGELYTFLTSRNGESVDVYGIEAAFQRQLDFLPGFLQYLNLYANYTYTKSEATGIYNEDGDLREGLMLPGTAPHMFNASLSFDKPKFSARLSLNYAAAYLDELGGNDFEDRYYDKQTFLDFNASYAIKDWMRVFFEANNLTNQPLRYYQGVENRMMQMEYYEPRFSFGFKFDF